MKKARDVLVSFLPFTAILLMIQGCASLEPLPRFRTSSTSFAPDQLPLAKRSTSDLLDPTKVGAYSLIKEEALSAAEKESVGAEKNLVIVNRSWSGAASRRDVVGLDREDLEEDLASNEEFGAEEPEAEEAVVQKLIRHDQAAKEIDETVETNPAVNRVDMMKEIVNLLGNPYRYGGMNAVRGLDCSAFVGTIYSRAFGVRLPRSSSEQFGAGHKIRKDDLKAGDLVFFKTRRRRAPVSHVGIYVGQNLFAHASTRHGVIISPIDQGYYQRTFVGARRVLTSSLTELKRP